MYDTWLIASFEEIRKTYRNLLKNISTTISEFEFDQYSKIENKMFIYNAQNNTIRQIYDDNVILKINEVLVYMTLIVSPDSIEFDSEFAYSSNVFRLKSVDSAEMYIKSQSSYILTRIEIFMIPSEEIKIANRLNGNIFHIYHISYEISKLIKKYIFEYIKRSSFTSRQQNGIKETLIYLINILCIYSNDLERNNHG